MSFLPAFIVAFATEFQKNFDDFRQSDAVQALVTHPEIRAYIYKELTNDIQTSPDTGDSEQ